MEGGKVVLTPPTPHEQRVYECKFCNLPMTGTEKYLTHLRAEHGRVNPKLNGDDSIDTGQAPTKTVTTYTYQCSGCGRCFKLMDNATAHLRDMQNDSDDDTHYRAVINTITGTKTVRDS